MMEESTGSDVFNDLYPADGIHYQPEVPKEAVEKLAKAREKATNGKKLLTDLIARFEKRIAFYDSVKSIPADVRADKERFAFTVHGNEVTQLNLISEKNYLESLLKTLK
jgi:hypothetical protein